MGSGQYYMGHIICHILNLWEEKEIKKPPKYQKNFLFDSDVKFPEFIIFGVKKCGTGLGFLIGLNELSDSV